MKVYVYIYTNVDDCPENGMAYIGITKDPDGRCREHLKADSLIGSKLRQFDFNFDIITVVENYEEAFKLEKLYIKKRNTLCPNGYNLTEGGEGHTLWLESSREKMRRIHEGMKHSPVSKEKMRRIKLRKIPSPETIAKIIATRKKNGSYKRSPETIEKIRRGNQGKKLSPETIAKRTATRRERGNYKHSPEAIENMRRAKTPEAREKIRVALTGRKCSPETIAKRIATRKRNKKTKMKNF